MPKPKTVTNKINNVVIPIMIIIGVATGTLGGMAYLISPLASQNNNMNWQCIEWQESDGDIWDITQINGFKDYCETNVNNTLLINPITPPLKYYPCYVNFHTGLSQKDINIDFYNISGVRIKVRYLHCAKEQLIITREVKNAT